MSDAEFDRLWLSGTPRATIAKLAGLTPTAISKRRVVRGLPERSRNVSRPHMRRKRKLVRCRCQNPKCMRMYEADPNPPIPPHACRQEHLLQLKRGNANGNEG
jgi:hypothetical protein